MGRGRGQTLCDLWGGIALGAGTLAFALFSSSSAGCSTNLVVLTRGAVTARGCAAFSIVSHIGIGLMVLGAVLLLGSFALAIRTRRQSVLATEVTGDVHAATASPVAGARDEQARLFEPEAVTASASTPPVRPSVPAPAAPVAARPEPVVVSTPVAVASTTPPGSAEPVLQVESDQEVARTPGHLVSGIRLPPGWYGNPNNPGKPVQWWDGTKLTDRREA
ncbi:MAG: hypothetical protein ABSF84_00710 [Acidimicrobiales bacterium]|jgi:hypothetical protein